MNLIIPSPPISYFELGPLRIHIYALCLLAGMILGAWWGQRRYTKRGGDPEEFQSMVLVAIIFGIIGARIYHVITDYQLYFGPGRNPWDALKIWNGGLGIWGAVALGAVAVWIFCRRHRLDVAAMGDVLAPALLLGQGIGRLGNWFNQELFGRPTDLAWGLYIDPAHRPRGYESYETFHPTFLYEMIWNLLGAAVLVWVEKRFKLGRGKVFACYLIWYTFGRFFIEALRIDPANTVGGIRINNYTSLVIFICGVIALIYLLIYKPGYRLWPFGGFPGTIGNPAPKTAKAVEVQAENGAETSQNEAKAETAPGEDPASNN